MVENLMENRTSDYHPFKYSGKELDMQHGLDLYDHGARMYDPAALLWTGVDELAEKHPEMSPYVMCADNPVNYVDRDGRDWYQAADGSAFWEDSHEDMIFVGETAYTNVGARYTISYESSGYSLTFEQNEIAGINDFMSMKDSEIPIEIMNLYDATASALENYSGNSAIGSNFRFYWAGKDKHAFWGNQYVSTITLRNLGKKAGYLSTLYNCYQLGGSCILDGSKFGSNTAKTGFGILGGQVGTSVGASTCVAIGTEIGLIGGPVGFIVGAAIGGVLGGAFGSYIGNETYDCISNIKYNR